MAEIDKAIAVHIPDFAAPSGNFPSYEVAWDELQVSSDIPPLPHRDTHSMKPRKRSTLPRPGHNLHTALDQRTGAEMQIEDPHDGGDESSTEASVSPQVPKKATLPVWRRRTSGRIPPTGPVEKLAKARKETKARVKMKTTNAKDVWEVEEVVGSLIEADTYIHYYEVKWRGYSSKDNTWEPKKNLQNCQEAIKRFEQSK